MDMPVRSYSSGMRARLAFGMSMGVAFDWYLVDEITAVGDTAFRAKCLAVVQEPAERRRPADDLALAGRHPLLLPAAAWCSSAARPTFFEDVEEAIALHERNMAA